MSALKITTTLPKLVHGIYRDFLEEKNEIFIGKKKFDIFKYFFSKHRLRVRVRTASPRLAEAVLTSTNNVCFGSKIRKLGIPPANHIFSV